VALTHAATQSNKLMETASTPCGCGRATTAVQALPPFLQKDMLEDHKRTGAYYQGVMQNRRQFEGKVVLDVGTGSGILAIFAAKAGAKKVYAVEATNMAKFAKELVKENDVRSSAVRLESCGFPPVGLSAQKLSAH